LEWEYYDALVAQDIQRENDRIIEGLEYLALYINPEGLKKVREARERASSTNSYEITNGAIISSTMDDDTFAQFLAENSEDGRTPVFNGKYQSG
jgi:hypothetical protein